MPTRRAPTRTWSTQPEEGAEIRFGTMVTAVRRDGDRVTGVTTGSGETIDAPMVINAAGPWCNKLNDMAGVHCAGPSTRPGSRSSIESCPRGWVPSR